MSKRSSSSSQQQREYQKRYQEKVKAAAAELGISASEYLRRRRDQRRSGASPAPVGLSSPVDARGRRRTIRYPDVPIVGGKRTCPICGRAVAARGFPKHWESHPAAARAGHEGPANEAEAPTPRRKPQRRRPAAGTERPDGPAVTFCPFCGEYIAGIFMIPRPER